MEAKVNWHGRLSFTGSAETGFEVPLGASPDVGGDNDGFRPLELLAISLAGCTAMDVISILRKKGQDVTDFEVVVHTSHANQHPYVFTEAVIEYRVTGHSVDETALRRSIELSATRFCPAQHMLSKAFPMKLRYKVFEENGGEQPALVKSGEWPESSGDL